MMVHLVNKSTGEEISVPPGETAVGRGPFLKVTDKRVSRLHATLRLQDGTLALCPKHKNPCFYKPAGGTKHEVLPKNQCKDLSHGDCFSLLPNDLVFSVVYETTENDDRTEVEKTPPLVEKTPTPSPVEKTLPVVEKTLPVVDSGDPLDMLFASDQPSSETKDTNKHTATPMDTSSPSKAKQSITKEVTEQTASKRDESTTRKTLERDDSVVKPKLTSTTSGSTGKRRTLPSWLSELSSGESVRKETMAPKKRKAPTKAAAAKKKDEDEDLGSPPPKKVAKKAPSTTRHKVRLSSSDEEEQKSSTGSKPAKPIISDESSVEEKRPKEPKTVDAKKPTKDDTVTPAADTKKPQCPYGSSCYRKNPVHFREYSHNFSASASASASLDSADGSVDTNDSDKPICPYGLDCYRKNPVHRRDNRHIDVSAKKKGLGKRRSERKTKGKHSVLQDDSDDDGEPNIYDYNDSFIDDDEEGGGGDSSSYGDSEDSDWSPGVKDDNEDVGELVSEAKDFISNEKMRRTT